MIKAKTAKTESNQAKTMDDGYGFGYRYSGLIFSTQLNTTPSQARRMAVRYCDHIVSDWIGSRLDYNNYNRLRAIHQITATTKTVWPASHRYGHRCRYSGAFIERGALRGAFKEISLR